MGTSRDRPAEGCDGAVPEESAGRGGTGRRGLPGAAAGGGFRLAQLPAVAGALVALDPNDGAIVALVGGFDFGSSKYNRVIQAQRQPGSAFKPFLYSAALERGFTPATLVNDAPIVLPGGGGAEGDEEWRPQNITRKFYGPTPMREGLVRSRNLVSIRLLRGAGIGFATGHMAQFGFGPQALPPNLTLALGTGQVTRLEMARGFAVFANGGALATPYFIQSVQGAPGVQTFTAQPARACSECEFDAPALPLPPLPLLPPPLPLLPLLPPLPHPFPHVPRRRSARRMRSS